MSIGIKVAVRCRPFTIDDSLGCKLEQTAEESGEVELINCDYSTKRFPFTYAWWSAYGYKRHLTGNNMQDAEDMKLVNQEMAYDECGLKIKSDLLGGNAVVLFAYGLSGSGKTYTVFGPDATDAPEAWFKHATPQVCMYVACITIIDTILLTNYTYTAYDAYILPPLPMS
jgi:hypothetical protein